MIKKREQVLVHCRCHCYHELSVGERATIFQSFNSLKDHESQSIYLCGCVNLKSDKEIRRRPRSDAPKSTGRQSFSYMVTSEEKSVKICQVAFLGLHGIKVSRLKRKVLNFGEDISDNRGKHGNHSKIDEDIKNCVREHIIKFPARESYYSRSKNQHKKYLDASLTIAEMHRIFLSENRDLQHTCSYRLY